MHFIFRLNDHKVYDGGCSLEEHLRKNANKYFKEKNWSEAIKCFQYILEGNEIQCDDTVYKKLGRCLRFEGDHYQAIKVLKEGIARFPMSIPLHNELFYLFADQNKWEDARLIVENLIILQPNEAKHYFKLGRCCNYLKQIELAEQYFVTALEKKHDTALKDIISRIAKNIDSDITSIESKYYFVGGKNNFGAIEHIQPGEKESNIFITKIVSAGKGKEVIFYNKICNKYPQLKNITPKLIGIEEFNKIKYITLEKIIGNRPDKNRAKDIINNVISIISSVRYSDELLSYFSLPKYRLTLKKHRSQAVSRFFSNIHLESTNKRLFMLLNKKLRSANYSAMSIDILRRLEIIIMNFKLYENIKPEKHYSLLHGDLGPHNILLKNDADPYVLDWNTYTVGASCFDPAYFLTRYKLSFEKIYELYLSNINKSKENKLDNIEKIFFIYALIVIWFQRLSCRDFNRMHFKYLAPAINQLEALAMQEVKPEQSNNFSKKMVSINNKSFMRKIFYYFLDFIDNLTKKQNKK
jgi:tetratricopeptide (TPR) repeat protein